MRRVLLGAVIPVAVVLWVAATGDLSAFAGIDGLGPLVELSVHRALQGFAIGALTGTLLGVLAAESAVVRELLTPTVRALRVIPTIAWIPVLFLLLGVGEATTIAVIAFAVALPVFAAASSSRREIAPLFAGLRQGLSQSWLILVAAELVTAPAGIGQLLVGSGGAGRVDRMLVAVVVIGVLALASDLLLGVAERLVRRLTADTATLVRNTDHL